MMTLKGRYVCITTLTILIGLVGSEIANAQNTLGKSRQDVKNDEVMAQQLRYEQQSKYSFAEAGTQDGAFVSVNSSYTLGANDIIEVTVLRHPEVSGQYIVNAEGNIQYDFVGDLTVAGMTKDEVTSLITEKLEEYIISPELNVKIIGYNSKVVYVIGEVGAPGKIFMQGDTITIREALIKAGLPLLSAKTDKSKLITPSANGKPKHRKVNVKKLLLEGDLRENLVMKPGDTLYIPPTGMTKVMRTIQPVTAPISNAAGAGRTLTTGF